MSEQLPTPTEADGAALFEAQQTGRAEMCLVDEAELRAIGFTPVSRGEGLPAFPQSLAPFDDPVVVAAGRRLVARGLALPQTSSRWSVQPSGPLLAWFVGHVLPANPGFLVNLQSDPAGGVERSRRRVTLVRGSRLTLVEYLEVPTGTGGDPLPVRIDAVRSDVLIDELVSTAFTPLSPGQQLTLDLVTTAAHGPARLVADHELVGLETRNHGLRKNSKRLRTVTPVALSNYIDGMLDELGSS